MTNQIDLVTVVTNKLEDFRAKDHQVAVALEAREVSRAQLSEAQKDLSDYIASVSSLASEITTELSSKRLAAVETKTVADSLKPAEAAEEETVEKDVKPAKTTVSDESSVSKKAEAKAASPKAETASGVSKPQPAEEKESAVDDEEIVEELTSKPVVEKKTTPAVGGLWDDDDDEIF
jgi:hypothetical protein